MFHEYIFPFATIRKENHEDAHKDIGNLRVLDNGDFAELATINEEGSVQAQGEPHV